MIGKKMDLISEEVTNEDYAIENISKYRVSVKKMYPMDDSITGGQTQVEDFFRKENSNFTLKFSISCENSILLLPFPT